MRILHTSDWHIGRQFHNVSLLDDQRVVLEQIIDIIQSREVDVLLIAGDIYDRSVPPASAVALLDDVLHRICHELSVSVIMIAGNHDSAGRLSFGSRQLTGAGLHIVGPLTTSWNPVVLSDQWGEVAFYGIPYVDPVIVNGVYGARCGSHDDAIAYLTESIREDDAGRRDGAGRTVVLSHCFIDGGDECDSERPLSMGGADKVSSKHFEAFSYTALGHLHGRQFKGKPYIRYSGSPMQYSFSEERHKKVVTLVELSEDGSVEIDDIALDSPHRMRTIEGELEVLIKQAESDEHSDDYLLVRLTDTRAILDPMGKLRKVYPNVLHLERPALAASGRQYGVDRELLKTSVGGQRRGALSMFEDFYQQVSDGTLTDKQRAVIEEMLDECVNGEES
ncbi:exonuclease sbcCD subunit D [Gammaproteobacteria bacterium 42_54_T18]|nr:exonuclease sbcCD subunit D [Gammaproteobacteria bacterium 42_54_T18]